MAKASLLKAACAAAMLAATPVLAQTSTAPNATGPGGSQATTPSHPTHHAATASHHAKHGSQSPTAQDAAVDRLNEQSYEAAQKGQPFSVTPSSSGSTTDSGGKM